jgi:hypothetical protein
VTHSNASIEARCISMWWNISHLFEIWGPSHPTENFGTLIYNTVWVDGQIVSIHTVLYYRSMHSGDDLPMWSIRWWILVGQSHWLMTLDNSQPFLVPLFLLSQLLISLLSALTSHTATVRDWVLVCIFYILCERAYSWNYGAMTAPKFLFSLNQYLWFLFGCYYLTLAQYAQMAHYPDPCNHHFTLSLSLSGAWAGGWATAPVLLQDHPRTSSCAIPECCNYEI